MILIKLIKISKVCLLGCKLEDYVEAGRNLKESVDYGSDLSRLFR